MWENEDHRVAMKPLTLDEFAEEAAQYDRLVRQSPDVDRFCSSSHWVLPAAQALMPRREPWIWRGASGYIAMMRGLHPDGWHYLEPLESMWKLASPLIGPDAEGLARTFVDLCRGLEAEWDLLLLGGLVNGSPLFQHLIQNLAPHYQMRLGRAMQRHCASLEGGVEGFVSRRSRKFRANLRRAQRAGEAAQVTYEVADGVGVDSAEIFRRLLRIETQSWKGISGVGIDSGRMHDFYALMVGRLQAAGDLRIIFAQIDGRDVAYILGGLFGDTFRGLQFSYLDTHKHLSLGNLCQLAMIDRLVAEGVEHYDLGSDIDYKKKWGEGGMKTITLVAFR